MRLRTAIRSVRLALVCVVLCCTNARAQSLPTPGSSCAPTVTCDEFKELTGKKVFPKVIIDDVTFDGPLSLPPATLSALTKELTNHELDGDPKWLDATEEVPIGAAWQDNGYVQVKVSARAIPHGGDATYQHFSVIVHVDEGLQYRIGAITFRSSNPDEPLAFPTEILQNLLPFRPGELCEPNKIRQGLDALRKMYVSKGYIDFTPTPETEIDNEHQTVSFRFVLDQQGQYRIRKVTVCGSNPNFEALLNSEVKPGDVFSLNEIQDFFDKHQSLLGPHFGSENVQYKRDLKNHTVDIAVSLRNCPLSQD